MNLLKPQKSKFNLDFANNTILSCFFFFFLIINLNFLIPAATTLLFNPIAELLILIEKPNKEAKLQIEIPPVIAEAKIHFALFLQ